MTKLRFISFKSRIPAKLYANFTAPLDFLPPFFMTDYEREFDAD